MTKFKKDDLLLLPLGGTSEIGMNVNLYHYRGKWLMIDIGAGFADDHYPGIQMLAPDLSFVYERLDDFLGIVLTHAHEDHLGSIGWLWDKLRCPIYAAPFTAEVARNKLQQCGLDKKADITIIPDNGKFDIGPFSLEAIHMTHSIPQMKSIVLRTEYGNILHTGDWKFDPNPVVDSPSDEAALKKLGDEGVLALVCDSTNVFNEEHSGSEGDLLESISKLISGRKGLVCVTTFASNVGRMETIARAAKANGRKVVTTGLSLSKISTFARDTGYLDDVATFLSDREIKNYPREKLLVMCTGCQGEQNAAMFKIASGKHPTIRLAPKDLVVFSSKIIPGNERKIYDLFNQLVLLGCDVYTEKDHFVHVSGHPSRKELRRMYELTKPSIAIPVHGEPVHLHEHIKLLKESGISNVVKACDGEVIKIAPNQPQSISLEQSGYLAVDGFSLHPSDGEVMKMRRKLTEMGIVIVSIVVSMNGNLATEPAIITPGVLDEKLERAFLHKVSEGLIDVLDAQRDTSDDNIYKTSKATIRRMFKEKTGKKPLVEIILSRV